MKKTFSLPSADKIGAFLKRYKLILLLIFVGLMLLLIPDEKTGDSASVRDSSAVTEEDFSVISLEKKMSQVLSRIEGAGEVSVMLTVQSSSERIYAVDRELSERDGLREMHEELVIASIGNDEEAILVGQNYPVFQGALLVCPGGDDPEIRLQLIGALSALTGLSSNRITVCKGF